MNEPGDSQDGSYPSQGEERYVLKLYITGTAPSSQRAVANARKFCEEHLEGRFELVVVDILKDPKVASLAQLIVAPTLVKESPLPVRRFIGDLSQTEKLLTGFDIR
jgi:circadian clock protein KaiB